MELNGIVANSVDTNGAFGEVVAHAADCRGMAMLLVSPVTDAFVARTGCVGTIRNSSCVLGIRQGSVSATARCCRSLERIGSHYENAGMYGSGDTLVRFGPMARGSDVNQITSHTERGRKRWGIRKRVQKVSGNIGVGAATNSLNSGRHRSGQWVPAIMQANATVAAELPVAIKSSSKNVASRMARSGCPLHAV